MPLPEHLLSDEPADQIVARRRVSPRRRANAFPLSIAQLLDLGPDKYVLVLGGRIDRLASRPRSDSATIEVMGKRLYTRPGSSLDKTLQDAVSLHLPSLRQWLAVQAGGSGSGRLDEIPAYPLAAKLTEIDAFVHEHLIPYIRDVGPGAPSSGHTSSRLSGSDTVRLPQFEPNFAFLGPRWCSLVPFFGKAGNRLTLRVDGDTYLALEGQPLSLAVSRFDGLLEDAVRTSLAAEVAPGGPDALYRDDTYSVVRTPRGRTYVVQRVPPYVVEGIDKKLYYFDGVDIGLLVRALQPRDLFTPQCVQVLQDYRHMFVYGFGNYICMPREQTYFRELDRSPLAEGILQQLEAARMTLCAGYMPQNAVMHPVTRVSRREIALDEARRRRLPIYWYYKPRRPLMARVHALLD